MTQFRRIALSTGVTVNIAFAGEDAAPAVILLHGFPESHRTWRELAPMLEAKFRLIMPDQRGFAGSDRPQQVAAYETDRLVEDIFALADTLGLERFALVGHDWGGAIAWSAALKGDKRLDRLVIINAPHPVIFQKSLIESGEQRAASQYINAFRLPGAAAMIAAMGYERFFDKVFGSNVDLSIIPDAEKQQYLAEWSQPGAMKAMLNWYRASKLRVPLRFPNLPIPQWALGAFPKVGIPTLVVWAMKDTALLPLQLDGLDELVEDLQIVRIPDAGHFVPWEKPRDLAAVLLPFLEGGTAASAAAT